ncbi:archaetidylserine decarboxylase [Pendulispora albinea]|uniref:phosphatidylserine decarboxylase n=1 Tax=Pendulispora albinea TaxID=2741071 RepID=A0ABZ2M8B5_9BACT
MSALSSVIAELLRVWPKTPINRVMGKLADHRWNPVVGRAVVDLYTRAYGISFEECIKREGWSSFDEFFTRTLRPGVRPIDPDPKVVVSPADGRVDAIGRVEPGRRFLVKGQAYSVDELVGDSEEAARYEGGGGCVVYLSPRDYHRVHAPAGGVIRHVRSMPGEYYPVNEVGVTYVPKLFVRNRRVSIAIDTPPETGLGCITVVMVAALVVGRITVAGIDAHDVPLGLHKPGLPIARGDEIGIFHLGSTAVLFLEPSAFAFLRGEGPVLYGQSLARASRTE